MRAITILVLLATPLVAAGCGRNRQAEASPDPGVLVPEPGRPGVPGSFAAEVAAVDPKKGTITLRNPGASGAGATAREKFVRVSGAAVAVLPSLEPGDQIVVSCDESAAGAASPAASPGPGGAGRDFGPAGGSIGIGATEGSSIETCSTVFSLVRVAGGGGE
jgi:hypothetical protein